MRDYEDAGSDKVTASTRAFEELDAQVFPGPGRGATRSEAAASDRWGGPSPDTAEGVPPHVRPRDEAPTRP